MRDDDEHALDRRNRILDGARTAFLRFGFERASIADIAAGAGVSRTAVYHYFPGKEDVLRAVVDELHAKSLAAADDVLATSQTLSAALTGLLEAKFGRMLGVTVASPHGDELVSVGHRVTGPATSAADEAFKTLVVHALVHYGRAEAADAVADTLIAAAKGLTRSGEAYVSKDTFTERLHRLIDWLIN